MDKAERMMVQLNHVVRRMETLQFANHEARIVGQMLTIVCKTIAGEICDIGDGYAAVLQEGVNVPVHLQQQALRGGVETSPGVIQYPPAPSAPPPHPAQDINVTHHPVQHPNHQQHSPPGGIQSQVQHGASQGMDIEAGVAAFTGQGVAGGPLRKDLQVTPAPGSMMAQAQGEAVAPPADITPEQRDEAGRRAEAEMEHLLGDSTPGPLPTETKVEQTPAPKG